MNNWCKFGKVLITTSGLIKHLMLCPDILHVFRSVTSIALRLQGRSGVYLLTLNVTAWCKNCTHDTIRNICSYRRNTDYGPSLNGSHYSKWSTKKTDFHRYLFVKWITRKFPTEISLLRVSAIVGN